MLKLSHSFFLATFLLLLQPCFAQTEILVDQFSLFEDEGEVQLTWVIKAGGICDGIEVERSHDGVQFASIGRIAGICGNLDNPIRFDFRDEAPVLNRTNFYRLRSANYIISNVVSLEVIQLGKQGFVAKPNPVNDAGKIYYSNNKKEAFSLQLFDLSGKFIREQESNDEFFDIDASQLNPGIYFFLIRKKDENRSISGKIIVAH